jgi:RNA polymerase sigma-70 factor (ECF subfamily)
MKNPMPHTDSTPADSELTRAALAGDVGSLGTLIERHFGTVYAVALARLRDPEIAEDLAQEVFLRAQLHLGQLGPGGNFPAWVTRIARNLAIDWLRRGSRASRLLPMVPLEELVTDVPDSSEKGARETMASQEEATALREAILNLPANQREVVLLHFSEDLTQQQISERLGVHQATVSRQIRGALKSLRGILEPQVRRVAPTLRAPRSALARSVAIAGAVGAMSASSKVALAAQTAQGISVLGKAPASVGGLAASLKAAWAAILVGGKIMTTGKGITVLAVTAAVIGGGLYMTSGSQSSEESSAASLASAVQQVDPRGEDDGTDREPVVGIYDSRAVAFAYWHEEVDGRERFRSLDEVADGILLHQQVFSHHEPVEALRHIEARLPEVMRQAGVDLIVSKWDEEELTNYNPENPVDVTETLVMLYNPDPGVLEFMAFCEEHRPEPLDADWSEQH